MWKVDFTNIGIKKTIEKLLKEGENWKLIHNNEEWSCL
jgi:hypothetical protein